MRYSDVETFLAIVTNKSVSKAANALFVAQSTASQRLQKLEYELGGPLIVRKKGIDGIVLTPKGEQFLLVAERLLNIWRETDNMIKREPTIPLVVGAPESLSAVVLPPLFMKILQMDKNIQMNILTGFSSSLYNMVERREVDFAFVFRELNLPRINCTPVFREEMRLICRRGELLADGPIDISGLDINKELFCSWSPEFRAWHNSLWDVGAKPLVTVDITSMLLYYMSQMQYWAVCPVSIANYLVVNSNLEAREIQNPPPDRITYLISHSTPMEERKAGMEIFHDCFSKFQAEYRGLSYQE